MECAGEQCHCFQCTNPHLRPSSSTRIFCTWIEPEHLQTLSPSLRLSLMFDFILSGKHYVIYIQQDASSRPLQNSRNDIHNDNQKAGPIDEPAGTSTRLVGQVSRAPEDYVASVEYVHGILLRPRVERLPESRSYCALLLTCLPLRLKSTYSPALTLGFTHQLHVTRVMQLNTMTLYGLCRPLSVNPFTNHE